MTDIGLVLAARAGDKDAFSHLVAQYAHAVTTVTSLALRRLGLGDDAAQETFVLAWQRIGTTSGP